MWKTFDTGSINTKSTYQTFILLKESHFVQDFKQCQRLNQERSQGQHNHQTQINTFTQPLFDTSIRTTQTLSASKNYNGELVNSLAKVSKTKKKCSNRVLGFSWD
ncbi:hypothetical protein ATANTOWER_001516 [Ataeniobius toweri]|uniref:Uncharacterized protein n=1 Tax=Ataeniobius toweri TaxID=208326 RepID=A0ABU7CEY1_9TELE|nr:hypothetical protein [Ataeniobius toweri]